ncbi:MAG: DUF2061 domain-containing protein [Pseudomonadota bacterium]
MNNSRRIIAKAITWQIVGLTMMTLIGYVFTGSFQAGGALAIASTAIGFVSYILHEKAWNAVPHQSRYREAITAIGPPPSGP